MHESVEVVQFSPHLFVYVINPRYWSAQDGEPVKRWRGQLSVAARFLIHIHAMFHDISILQRTAM